MCLPLDSHPTDTLVGSAERVEVYRRRRKLGLTLYHPLDSKLRVDLVKGSTAERSLRRTGHARDLPRGIDLDRGRYRVRVRRGGSQVLVGRYLTLAEAVAALQEYRAAGDGRELAS